MSRVTIADVARAAEVSTATVSNALNGTGRLGSTTRARVRAIAAALGYGSPAVAPALALATTTSQSIGGSSGFRAYFARLVGAATAAAHQRGYALFALPSDFPLARWQSLPVAGALLLDRPADDPAVHVLRDRGLPLVFDGRRTEQRPGETWIDNDYVAATRRVLDHLAAEGARNIAVTDCPAADDDTRSCLATYRDWCAEQGVEPNVLPMAREDTEGRLLDPFLAGASRPDAVHGLCDTCGHRLLAAARRLGISVPDGLLVSCLSADPDYARTHPTVTTVSLTPVQAAHAAVGALASLIADPGTAHPPRLLPITLHLPRPAGPYAN
ncbi:LacI family DNA-binding transcriptional regulator [Streptomyces sp. MBT62]|uniref:LacI family DNA-binding transcriptional regulator n=1 Tax=Streptomyces sp. MBT62 TaxID=2800410 RepID=UPI00190CCAFD|nr:LacI family DNA-binding transcriptional regulator [Streptomyces sp. MBT62]MBK3569482.1 LacI family DNA-binding transcriptional regulator [Streptomyces sp. MBT62]